MAPNVIHRSPKIGYEGFWQLAKPSLLKDRQTVFRCSPPPYGRCCSTSSSPRRRTCYCIGESVHLLAIAGPINRVIPPVFLLYSLSSPSVQTLVGFNEMKFSEKYGLSGDHDPGAHCTFKHLLGLLPSISSQYLIGRERE